MAPVIPRMRNIPGVAQVMGFPAPTGGMNTVSPGTAMPQEDCTLGWNIIPSENGLRARIGFKEWCTTLNGTTNDKVRTLMAFTGAEPSQNRLFAATDTFIWDCSTSSPSPSDVFTFANPAGDAGYGTFRVVVTAANHFGVYCDEVNGLHVYNPTGGTWAAVAMGGGASQIANVNPANLVHATVFKQRVWFTERDSASAWYLGAGAIFGSATEFNFGTQFKMGGHLVGLYNWTYDGGAGADDALVAVSSTGDVVVCTGIDPSDASSFNVRGTWNVGPPPVGRDIAIEVGGDLWILSSTGLMPLSRLVVGADTKSAETAKISNLFNALMLTRRTSRGWSLHIHPEDNALLVLLPDYSTDTNQALAQSQTAQRGWFRYRSVPMHCATVWEGRLHFGTQDGRVCVSRDYLDNVAIDDPSSYERVDCVLIPAFQRAGGGNFSINQIRALFITDGTPPDVTLQARYDLDQSDLTAPTASAAASGTWDNATWDASAWGGDATSTTFLQGAVGVGHTACPAVRFKPIGRTTLVQLEAQYETGGFL